MQLKTGREAWKNNKTGIFANSWQSVRNHCEFRNVLAISSQPLRISQSVGKQFAISVRIAKFASHMQCSFAKFASHIKLQNLSEISHCQLRKPIANFANHIANFANPLPISQTTLPTSQTHCQIRNPLPNSQTPLPNSQTTLPNSQSIAKFTSFAKFTFAGLVILCN